MSKLTWAFNVRTSETAEGTFYTVKDGEKISEPYGPFADTQGAFNHFKAEFNPQVITSRKALKEKNFK